MPCSAKRSRVGIAIGAITAFPAVLRSSDGRGGGILKWAHGQRNMGPWGRSNGTPLSMGIE